MPEIILVRQEQTEIKEADREAVRKLPWMLASKIAGTSAWLIQRKDEKPTVWSAA